MHTVNYQHKLATLFHCTCVPKHIQNPIYLFTKSIDFEQLSFGISMA